MRIKSYAKALMPPIVMQYISKQKESIYGNYSTWEAAEKVSGKYSPDMTTIINAHKLYRDNKPCVYNNSSLASKVWAWTTLAGLLIAARESDNKLTILDFGGG